MKSRSELRDYQQRAIDQVYAWFEAGHTGHPCIVMPTGSGKSHVIAELCRDAITSWPETRILMLTHVKELIAQNNEKLLEHWPGAPVGIYSAGLRSKRLDQISFGSIQSLRGKEAMIGHIDLILVDEAHLIGHERTGGYRTLIAGLLAINPALRVIGLTATPWRLGHGTITDGDALFSEPLIEPASIEELIHRNFLAPLRSKATETVLDTTGVHMRGGDFIESELQAAVNTTVLNDKVTDEIIRRADGRKHWLCFCVGVKHAERVRDALRGRGIAAEMILGSTPHAQRADIIDRFKAGEITALTNANVLTTGFDYPEIDLIALIRPTKSPSLYVQMAGRGMRIKGHVDDCVVLDFGGLVMTHGPITAIDPPGKKGNGDPPMKICPECQEIIPLSCMTCPACGHEFEAVNKAPSKIHNLDIMGLDADEMDVESWKWRSVISRTSGKPMLTVRYYSRDYSVDPVTEYITIAHEGYAGERSRGTLAHIARQAGAKDATELSGMDEIAERLNIARQPTKIKFRRDGKFYRVTDRVWQ